MILLDTDHATELEIPESARGQRLAARLNAIAGADLAVSVVTVEEQLRGRLAAIAGERQPSRLIAKYRQLAALVEACGRYTIAPFNEVAAVRFLTLGRIRIGTMDKKIAAIALVNNALLLTANRRDFEQVPGLNFANWMD